jgi:hypothetical protein
MNDDENVVAPIEHAYYVIEASPKNTAAADSIGGSGEEPLDLGAPLNDTSIHVRSGDVEILTKI